MSTGLLEAPAPSPSGKDPAAAERRVVIQSSARQTLKRRRSVALSIRILFGAATVLTLIPLFGLVGYVTKRGVAALSVALFAYSIIVVHTHFSAYSASIALAVLMLPIIIRGDEEAMRTVPSELWEAGLALGARQSRVVRSVVVRGAIPGLVTANLLAFARAVGETAPLLFTAIGSQIFSVSLNQPMNAIPIVIYQDGTTAFTQLQLDAWGAAFVLMVGVLVLSIVGRIFAARMTRKSR